MEKRGSVFTCRGAEKSRPHSRNAARIYRQQRNRYVVNKQI